MVLDEETLERMLRKQRHDDEDPTPAQAQLTDKTDEFEVYERPDPDAPPADARTSAQADADARDAGLDVPPPHPGPPDRTDAGQPDAGPAAAPEQAPQGEETLWDDEPHAARPASTGAGAAAHATAGEAAAPQVHPPLPGHRAAPVPEPRATHAPTHAPRADGPTERRAPVLDLAETKPGAPARPATGHGGAGAVRVAIVQADFNAEITDAMAATALAKAAELGCQVTHHAHVHGIFDAPLTAQVLAEQDDVDCVVVIGAVIQGDTDHDQIIAHATARSLQQVALATRTPVGLGITGPGMSWADAQARIGNAGHAVEAAVAQWRALQVA